MHMKHFTLKRDTFQNIWFFGKFNCTYTFEQIFWCKTYFVFNHLKANSPSISEHLREALKKPIESVSMLIPRGGGVLKPARTPP